MPVFDFYCKNCDIKETKLVFKEKKVNCNKCGKEMEKLFSPTKNILPINGIYTSKNNYSNTEKKR